MEAKLHLVKGNPKGKQVEVPPGTLTVGRAEDSDLIIASTRVSRHHCELVNDQGRLLIRDKGSGNGSFVNGIRVDEQVLAPGDEVRIGPLTFAVEIGGVRAAPAARAAPAPRAATPAPKAKPKSATSPKPKGKPKGDDILASLERMAGKPGAPGEKRDDVLEISDEDLLDPNG